MSNDFYIHLSYEFICYIGGYLRIWESFWIFKDLQRSANFATFRRFFGPFGRDHLCRHCVEWRCCTATGHVGLKLKGHLRDTTDTTIFFYSFFAFLLDLHYISQMKPARVDSHITHSSSCSGQTLATFLSGANDKSASDHEIHYLISHTGTIVTMVSQFQNVSQTTSTGLDLRQDQEEWAYMIL